jgi:hypothetical protein
MSSCSYLWMYRLFYRHLIGADVRRVGCVPVECSLEGLRKTTWNLSDTTRSHVEFRTLCITNPYAGTGYQCDNLLSYRPVCGFFTPIFLEDKCKPIVFPRGQLILLYILYTCWGLSSRTYCLFCISPIFFRSVRLYQTVLRTWKVERVQTFVSCSGVILTELLRVFTHSDWVRAYSIDLYQTTRAAAYRRTCVHHFANQQVADGSMCSMPPVLGLFLCWLTLWSRSSSK